MGLFSTFQRSAKAEPDAAEDLQRVRSRARQRLIGATLLVGIGIVGFPLIFESHPRPIPIDTPIEIANKDKVPPLAMPPARTAPGAASAARPPREEVLTESAADAGREVSPTASAPSASTRAASGMDSRTAAVDKPHDKPSAKPADKTPPKPAPKPVPDADAARAKALLEGRAAASVAAATPSTTTLPTPAAGDARFVVQVGAYAETDAARDMRQKVEKLGLKTYTQVVETSSGSRIRVRVGPFSSKEEADRAAGRLKSAGLPAALLTL